MADPDPGASGSSAYDPNDYVDFAHRLKKAGIPSNKQVVVYCTGGVRSGWLVMLLADLGYKDARNYAGSMWEWAARPAKDYPLTRK